MMNELIHSIMTREPVTVKPTDHLDVVRSIFQKSRIHHIPVVDDDGALVGLMTTYDMWKLDVPFSEYASMRVADHMSTNLARISPTDKVGTAAELFLDNRFHALPVVENSKLVGIVTSFDILRYNFRKEYDRPILYKDEYEHGIKVAV